MKKNPDFKGNQSALPSQPCAVCGRAMGWRKPWTKNGDSVRCGSGARRAKKKSHG